MSPVSFRILREPLRWFVLGCVLLSTAIACGGASETSSAGGGGDEPGYYDPSTHPDPATTILVSSVAELEVTIQSTKGGDRTVLIADGVIR